MAQADISRRMAEMTRKSAQRGSKNFVWVQPFDERMYWPSWRGQQSDNPFAQWRGTWKFRWIIMDFRIFGFKEAIRKNWYMQCAWHSRGERIYMGTDENGNKYWQSWDAQRSGGGRWVEPADPHWFRICTHVPPPAWQMWLGGVMAHTPAIMQARGEWGPHGRMAKSLTPFNVRWRADLMTSVGNDPTHVPSNSVFFSPWSSLLKEAGYARYIYNRNPMWAPMVQPHDLKQEIVEDFFRRDMPFCQWHRGQDHDEWRA